MFSGGDYEEVTRWLANFVLSHARRENLRAEALVDAEGAREGKSYGVRVRIGARVLPPPSEQPLELSFPEVADGRGSLEWCSALAARVRALAREPSQAERPALTSA